MIKYLIIWFILHLIWFLLSYWPVIGPVLLAILAFLRDFLANLLGGVFSDRIGTTGGHTTTTQTTASPPDEIALGTDACPPEAIATAQGPPITGATVRTEPLPGVEATAKPPSGPEDETSQHDKKMIDITTRPQIVRHKSDSNSRFNFSVEYDSEHITDIEVKVRFGNGKSA